MRNKFIYLILVTLLASVLRLYQLGQTPISLEWDEVAIGFDAYSILKTGRDQFGKFLPLTFRSLDDYKPPIYEYITVPSVAIFGLTPIGVRFPSAFFGILTIPLTYFFVAELLKKSATFNKYSDSIGLLSAFFLAVSPWHLQFSRAAFEVNVSVFITLLAVTLFIKGLKNHKFFLLSAAVFGLNLFSYHSTRIVSPLLLLSLFILFNKELPGGKVIIKFFILFGLFFLFFIPIALSADAQIRFKATNIFNPAARYLDEKDLAKIFLEKRLADKSAGFENDGKIFHNQRLIYTDYETVKKAFEKYLSNFGFEFLFIKGDAPLHHAPDFGLLHFIEFPLILSGLFLIFRRGLERPTIFLLLWFIFVPIPDAVTREAPHAVRSELFLPMFQILGALGLLHIILLLLNESRWVKFLFISSVSVLFMINHSFYLHQYYVHTNFELSRNWIYGRYEAVKFTEAIKEKYDEIIVSLNVDMPYIFWLFYSKYPPDQYLLEGGTVSGGFADERNHFSKYYFRNFNYTIEARDKKRLYVGIPRDFPPDADFINKIYYLDGSPAIYMAQN